MKLKLAVLPGDGIGPEVVEQALNVTKVICEKFGHELEYKFALCGAHAIDEVGDPYPEETHQLCLDSDAVLYGAVGDPKYDNNPNSKVRPEQGLLAMRKKLGLFANIRPIQTFDCLVHKSPLKEELVRGADFICIRELTGGMYFGEPKFYGERNGETMALDSLVYKKSEVERIARQHLTPQQWRIFRSHDIEGLGYDTIARQEQMLEATVRKHVSRARMTIRQIYNQYNHEP